jgi:hypothetical protein
MRTVAKTFDGKIGPAEFKIMIPGVGWRKVSDSRYSCPYWVAPGATEPFGGKGLRGHVSVKGKRVWIQWIPDAPIFPDVEAEGRLRFGR